MMLFYWNDLLLQTVYRLNADVAKGIQRFKIFNSAEYYLHVDQVIVDHARSEKLS